MSLDKNIAQWESDCREELQVDHENEVFLKFALLADILGHRHVAYGLEYSASVAAPPFSFYCNFSENWQEKFLDRTAKNHGSKVCYGKRTSEPLPGAGDYFWTRADFLREAYANNVNLEWLDAIEGRGGTIAMIGLGGLEHDSPEIRQKTHILIDLVIEAMEDRLLRKNLPQLFNELNEQERQYLLWVLDGKTSDVIASIMGIKESQVKYMQRTLPPQFDRAGIYPTAFFAYRLGLLR